MRRDNEFSNGDAWILHDQLGNAFYRIDKSPTVLGRTEQCDIVVGDSSVSEQHVQFTLTGKALIIDDLRSKTGSFINGKRFRRTLVKIAHNRPVGLRVGESEFTLTYGKSPSEATESSDGTPITEEWFVARGNDEWGPLSADELFAAVDRGAVLPTDDIWRGGMDYRVKAYEVDGLLTEENPSGKPKSEETDFTSGKTICPYCWHRFGNEDTLFIASHPDLLGDPVMGEDQPRRFLPSRFTPEGQALDAGGVVCPDLACPNCHMRLPGDILAFAPLFMSVVGSPGSGKSYFLASATWTLRTTLPSKFGIQFMDVDAVTNQWLNAYEEKLFLQADRNAYQVIVKTEDNISASVYRNVTLHNMRVMLPMPCLFTIKTGEHCAPTGRPSDMTLVLYDNAGEHFQAGRDRADEPVTKHLVHAEGILFLFDPTEDPRFGPVLQNLNTEGAPPSFARQDVLLIEMITRIRKHLGLRAGQRLKKTMMIGISKADRLGDLFPLDESPWRKVPGSSTFRLDLEMIGCVSDKARRLMLTYAPEIVTTVESIAETVVYLPNSALGHDPAQHGVRPTDITPRWVEVPVLYTLARLGYIPTT